MITFKPGNLVGHLKHGLGRVIVDEGPTAVARFAHGIEGCDKTDLTLVKEPLDAAARGDWDPAAEVLARTRAEAILSVNDAWGVLSRSRVKLLPHQLWVCRRVLERWPSRWLVADDVGLGKTIEAGLILTPLLARGTVGRLLVLTPASLVSQWQQRLLNMFDIRLTAYHPDLDTSRLDFWGTNPMVVASLETLREDRGGRHRRIEEAEPWDLLIVDEAHRLNADEQAGPTLGYKFVDKLIEAHKVESVVFFTGTPHRGKDFGFYALMKLLRPDLFDPRKPYGPQAEWINQLVIRNNKQNVTDLEGNRLFQAPLVENESYHYSDAEAHFYATLTDFIASGKAYAGTLARSRGQAVMLVLIAMQKLASSSVAAVASALRGRLARMESARSARAAADHHKRPSGAPDPEDEDALNARDERVAQERTDLRLIEGEEARLRELVAKAEAVAKETKVERLIELIRTKYADRSILLFTEYKATQALVMSALQRNFGDGCVAFINGDDRIEGVVDASGRPRVLTGDRTSAAEAFNEGRVRFLVSTEAGGEGIDLQERCHTLIHVDLPWNPMRLHQRVGRLNRYGQTKRVEVMTLRNPDTVEARIWEKLDEKVNAIMRSLGRAMDEPEDLMQLVLGMTSPTLFQEIFSEASSVPALRLNQWFDQKTARFGGRDAVDAVHELVGRCARFDFGQSATRLPRIELEAIRPFLQGVLRLNKRQYREEEGGLTFRVPDKWRAEPRVRREYSNLTFDRNAGGRDAAMRVLGVGHPAVDEALKQAARLSACATILSRARLPHPLLIFRIADRVTGGGGTIRSAIVGYESDEPGEVLVDWRLLERLNELSPSMGRSDNTTTIDPAVLDGVREKGFTAVTDYLPQLDLGFRHPAPELCALFWPD